jgi:hypothetical protein
VVPPPEGAFLDDSTFLGKGLLRGVLNTKPITEAGTHLWEARNPESTLDVESACERLAGEVEGILEELVASRAGDGDSSSLTRLHIRVFEFADFLLSYLSTQSASPPNAIQYFGSKQLRLTELALDRIDGTVLLGEIDLSDHLILIGLSFLRVLMAACYQLCCLTANHVTILGADQTMSRLSRRLLQYLLSGGFDSVQEVIRGMRAKDTRNADLKSNSVLLDIWSTLYHLLQNQNELVHPNIRGFWGLVELELEIGGTPDARCLDRAWYTIINVSAITTFEMDGIAHSPSKRSTLTLPDCIWNIVEKIMIPFLQSYSAFQHNRIDSYIRTLFGRCYTLISSWNWLHGAKSVLTAIYSFYTDRRFDNLKTEDFGVFPKFFNSEPTLEINSTDTTFMIFLKLTISYIKQQQAYLHNISGAVSRRQQVVVARDIDRFVNRITPLRTYQSTFSPLDYIALQNHYRLLLTLYWIAPKSSRPSVERIRDVIDIEKAPNPAQVICLETWSLLVQIQLKRNEDISSSVEWVLTIFRHSLDEYLSFTKLPNGSNVEVTEMQIKSKIRASESILLKALQSLAEVIPDAKEAAATLVGGILLSILADLSCYTVPVENFG